MPRAYMDFCAKHKFEDVRTATLTAVYGGADVATTGVSPVAWSWNQCAWF